MTVKFESNVAASAGAIERAQGLGLPDAALINLPYGREFCQEQWVLCMNSRTHCWSVTPPYTPLCWLLEKIGGAQ